MKTIEEASGAEYVLEPPGARKLQIILNPEAGNGQSGRRWPEFAKRLSANGYDYEVFFTDGPGNASAVARDIAVSGAGTLVAIGGDGTINEIINGLIENDAPVNPDTRLAIISCGTGQDLCRSIGTRTIEQTIEALNAGCVASIDLGRMTFQPSGREGWETRYFVNVADAGLGARVASQANAAPKILGTTLSYLIQAVRTIAVFEPKQMKLWVDGEEVYDARAHMVVFANGRNHAGGMLFAPTASLTDGLFDIFILTDVSKFRLLTSILPRVYFGKHVGQPGVIHLRGKSARVETPDEMLVEMDGETPGQRPSTIDILPNRLKVVTAAGTLD